MSKSDIATEALSVSLSRTKAEGLSPYAAIDSLLSMSLLSARMLAPEMKLADFTAMPAVAGAEKAQRSAVQSPYHRIYDANRRSDATKARTIVTQAVQRAMDKADLRGADKVEVLGAILAQAVLATADIPDQDAVSAIEDAFIESERALNAQRKRVERKQQRQDREEWSGSRP